MGAEVQKVCTTYNVVESDNNGTVYPVYRGTRTEGGADRDLGGR